jgi:hypothetical protein
MKNIHILQTEKPSRLFKFANQLQLDTIPKEYYKKYNIYITSDEDIKEGDWCYQVELNDGKVDKCYDVTLYHTWTNNGVDKTRKFKKIILTTDQDLIKDGVQSIDDEFLEWFVKNPSCEFVEVVEDKKFSSKNIYDAVEGDLVYSHHGYGGIINSLSNDVRVGIGNYIETAITSETGWETLDINNYRVYDKCYKIIIPQEEPKLDLEKEMFELEQELDIPSHLRWHNSKPKQEKLEEAAEIILANNIDGLRDALKDDDLFYFYKGVIQCYGEAMAKWQQEQILDFLYKEITERRDYSASKMCEKVIEFIQQFKNK